MKANPAITNTDQHSQPQEMGEGFSDGTDGTDGAANDQSQAGQNSFYPSYSSYQNQPLGHSRPFYYSQQEAAYSQRPYHSGFDQNARFSGYKDFNPAPKTEQAGLLGSGNFGVIPGGTFYGDNDENSNYADYDNYYYNGHGRPQYYLSAQSNPKPYTHEQFANFRDFADINTPDRQYSQYVVVYAPTNKNKTEDGEGNDGKTNQIQQKPVTVPRNIIESLTLLDMQGPSTTATVPEKKISKSKRKLALLPPVKKHLQKRLMKMRDQEEPLMALS
ncbi:unnamed protein product [Psylliodes chrysocephalus]|uniref:Uncharacterized protein n=1 Tax=Psylliodes chrysocephalus TaxID=3402493 RepID=A0A9P0D9S8_9CUCU|nr:unnamed protein product [Psylliodes chrysocephala]